MLRVTICKKINKYLNHCVRIARLFGFEPKVAFIPLNRKPLSRNTRHVRDAIEKLKKEKVDFDFDGEMHLT